MGKVVWWLSVVLFLSYFPVLKPVTSMFGLHNPTIPQCEADQKMNKRKILLSFCPQLTYLPVDVVIVKDRVFSMTFLVK
jgi:hypothetical protein